MDLKRLVKVAFPEYRGRKVKQDFSGKVFFTDTNWSGGTKNSYVAVDLGSGERANFVAPAPWNNLVEGKTAEIPSGFAVVVRHYFCGKDCGVTVHYGPSLPNFQKEA